MQIMPYKNFTPLKEHPMLYTIAVILIVLWLLGLVSSYTLGGFVHILLVNEQAKLPTGSAGD